MENAIMNKRVTRLTEELHALRTLQANLPLFDSRAAPVARSIASTHTDFRTFQTCDHYTPRSSSAGTDGGTTG